MKLQAEYQRMEIISGALRPMRLAIQPEATAPRRRIHKVKVPTKATAVREASNPLAMETIRTRKTVKSKPSSVQPSQAAV